MGMKMVPFLDDFVTKYVNLFALYMLKHARLFNIQNKREISLFPRSKCASEYNNNIYGANHICTQICINLKVVFSVFFVDIINFREFANLNVVYEQLNIFSESDKRRARSL